VIGVWVWKDAQSTKREIASLEHQISIIEPDVQRIQLAEQRWRVLEPAFEKNYFPVVQLSRITAALPGSGVVIREYRTSGRNVRVRGQARDVQLANRLLEDLQGIDGFEAYEWSMPNPKVEKNNTATFEIEGKLKNAGADS
jgi:Tfp pilus assembly protein PilN